ncbi:2-succinylbenzoate--CoA ligase [Paraliobacillus quinghaiensis]|uniref:2-succinylbenzoate--CoA ligase n=1 Tax=Paraliobacillus quinghaiensis TaxID=470815 RepID=A0A917TUW3_9BACI|nr:o-succinylbenzoate--CoA ligase [Paraliobacillus quinghaiensis]GGM37002.1 2-succinylbenzoate--CoA ligase [Paraliobacillus quinghaiensis]
MKETMPHWLDKQADLAPDNNAIESPLFDSITFSVLRDRAQQFAKRLASLGVKEGDHVAIYAPNSLEMVIAIHGLSYVGAVVVLLNTRLSKNELAFQIRDANVSYILTDEDNIDHFKDEKNVQIASFITVEKLQGLAITLKTEIYLDDVFTIMYTSGTTGKPKGVVHTYRNHWSSAIASALNLGIDRQDKWLATLPLFHIGGFSLLMKNVIYGMPIYLLDKFDVTSINQAILRKGVTIVSVVSVMLDRLIENLENQTYPAIFRCMLLGGGPASKHLLEKAKKHQIPVFQTYGMTETSSQIVTLSPADAFKKIGSAGKALFSAQIKILKDDQATAPLEVGEIFVKGPMVTNGYYQNEEANRTAFNQEWLATGDLGYLDGQGFLYVMDRRKDLIVSGGENIYPAEVEHVLVEIDGIKEAGVVGQKDAIWGKVPVAFLVADRKLDFDIVKQQCSESLAKYKIPKSFHIVEYLPRNASNKLLRYQLEEMLE